VQNLKTSVLELENNLKLAREGFKLILGMELDRDFTLSGELQMADEEYALEQLTADALENRAEIRGLQKAERIARLSRSIARRTNLPSLVGGAAYDRSKPFGLMGDEWGSNVTFNLAFQWTLFSGFGNLYKNREAALALKETLLAQENLQRAITIEVKQAYLSFLAAREAIGAAAKNVIQARNAFDIIETRYKNGLATNLEVLDTELAYRQAQVNHLNTLKNYHTSLAAIHRAIGKEE
jgi:outer membrane protein TolC